LSLDLLPDLTALTAKRKTDFCSSGLGCGWT
jgi:hypothetical protein